MNLLEKLVKMQNCGCVYKNFTLTNMALSNLLMSSLSSVIFSFFSSVLLCFCWPVLIRNQQAMGSNPIAGYYLKGGGK